MSTKINVKDIVVGHLKTLIDSSDNKYSFSDIFTFFILPVLFAAIGLYFSFNLNKDLVSLLVNFGSIFTALLLSVLVLVYDQEGKLNRSNEKESSLYEDKKEVLRQLYYNICYSIIVSVILVVIAFLHTTLMEKIFHIDFSLLSVSCDFDLMPNIHILTPIIIIVTTNLIMTILMIVKRLHILLTTSE